MRVLVRVRVWGKDSETDWQNFERAVGSWLHGEELLLVENSTSAVRHPAFSFIEESALLALQKN